MSEPISVPSETDISYAELCEKVCNIERDMAEIKELVASIKEEASPLLESLANSPMIKMLTGA